MSAFVALSLGALATWLLRVAFIAVLPADRLPEGLLRALRHVGPAVLGALVVTTLVGHDGLPALFVPSARHLALLAAALVAVRFRNLAAPIAAALLVMLVAGALP
jgi:branched-subunit amino acid transport protein